MADLVRTKLNRSLSSTVKSLDDLVRVRVGDKIFLLCDVSGSMDTMLRNGKMAYQVVRDVTTNIRKERPTEMIAFGGRDGGAYVVQALPHPSGGTPLAQAINLAKTRQANRAIVISDGIPDSTTLALEAARNFGGQIDVVYVGDPGDAGEMFLKQLAEATGGTEFHGDLSEPKALEQKIMGLLDAGDDDDDE